MVARTIEFVVFFCLLPFVVAAFPTRYAPPIPILWIGAIVTLLMLRRDHEFERSTLWGVSRIREGLPGVLRRFLLFGPLLAGFAWLMEPEHFLAFPRDRPGTWAAVLFLYPILSVVPQGIVYRTFFLHRYRDLFGDGKVMWMVAAVSFALAHVVMHRWEPVAITLVGGFIFTRTLMRGRSGLLADAEHALYGDLAFTLGLGVWIYTGAARQGL